MMSSKILGNINQSQDQGENRPGLSDIKALLERLKQRGGNAEPNYDPIQPGGGAIRVLPFIFVIVVLSLIFGVYELFISSDPYKLAEKYIKENKELQASLGPIIECDPWVPFNFNISGGEGRARLAFSVKGTSGSAKVYVALVKRQDRWEIISAQYKDRSGILMPLVIDDKYIIQSKSGESASSPLDKSRQYLSAGHINFKKQEYDKAITEYSLAIERDKSGYQGYYWRGMAYTKKNMDKEAFADFSKVIELMPKNAAAHNWLGWLHSKNKRYTEAIVSLSQAIEIIPNNGWSYYQRGQCYLAIGDRTKALDDFKKGCSAGNKNSCRILDVIKKRSG
jgi:tetratricopeptide (TPR) repeat protein